MFNKKEIREFRGISDVVIAKILKDTDGTLEYGPIEHLAGVAKLSKTTESNQETKYYDNLAALTITSEGADTVTLETSAIDMETLAKISGKKYDKTNNAIIESEPEVCYFALGYKCQDTAGHSRYVWRYKVQFTIPDEEYNTKTADTSSNGQTIECQCVYPTTTFTYKFDGKNITEAVKSIVISDEGSFDVSNFFEEVVTPDVAFPVAE